MRRALIASLLLAAALPAVANGAPVTPAGWRVKAAGTEFGVSKLSRGFQGPLASVLSPDGKRLLSASSGAARSNSVDLFSLRARRRVQFVPYDGRAGPGKAVFYGLAFSPKGRRAWAAGGGQNVVHTYRVRRNRLRRTRDIPVPNFPAGLAYGRTPRGGRIYVANNLGGPAAAGNPPGHSVTVINPKTNRVTGSIDLGTPLAPLGVTFERRGRKAYVTNWLGRSVSVISTGRRRKIADIVLSPPNRPLQADHPSAITENPKRNEVYTANANSDTVSVIDTRRDRLKATIDVRLIPGAPPGATPDGLDVSPDGRTLYVAEAGENAVAVVDLRRRRVRGFIPTAWYPTDVEVTPGGKRLVVTNTNNSGAGPNPCGPFTQRPSCPGRDEFRASDQYAGSMIKGSVSVVRLPLSRGRLRHMTSTVRRNNQALGRSAQKPPGLDQIKHVIYVIKENRTYDQMFGDLGKGNGDPSLALFKDDSAPNHRELASRFALFDNFYADAEVSADGHNWMTQANANDYVEKMWPITYSPGPRRSHRAFDFWDVPRERQFLTEPLVSDPTVPRSASAQSVGYLWDNAYARGVSYRNYGIFTRFGGSCANSSSSSSTTHLDDERFGDHVNERYPAYNLFCSDHIHREPVWERDFRAFEARGNLPALSIVHLPNDHTRGTAPGAATPRSYVADNDMALGRLVDVVSHSRFWRNTVVLVAEDDAQNGPDHVDAHRTVALAISPYTQTSRVDSTHYSTTSMIATLEDLLGLPPMGIVDERATRMWPAFTSSPNFAPYDARTPSVTPFGKPEAPTNPPTAPLASASARWDFGKVDATPEIALNKAIWKSVKGRRSAMPRPKHRIIGSRPTDESE